MAAAAPKHWLVKQEPTAYAWSQFAADGRAAWTGVRNFQARNFLRAMRVGQQVLYYHSVNEKAVVGLAKVVREAYPDPTAENSDRKGDWVCVDLAPVRPLAAPVPLARIKEDAKLKNIYLMKQGRLSVMPLKTVEFNQILRLSESPKM